MRTGLLMSIDGAIESVSDARQALRREHKGKSILELANSFVVLDFETTGLDPAFDEVLEIGAIKVLDGDVVDEYSTLIKPEYPIGEFITGLTGITDDMVKDAPAMEAALPDLLSFIGDSVIVGHNIHFDINFLYDNCIYHLDKPFANDFIDTMRIARNAFKDVRGYKLKDLAVYFGIEDMPHHRAKRDCRCTLEVYNRMRSHLIENNIDLVALNKANVSGVRAKDITAATTDFNENNPFYNKVCVFTGTLDKMQRKDAMQLVADLGGVCADNITKKTNFLILGATDYNKSKDGKSNKHKKAEQYQLAGLDIEVISENVFYDMLNEQ